MKVHDDPALRECLRRHVHVLAELIGERNSTRSSALEAARAYLCRELERMGCQVRRQPYPTSQREAVNLEVVLTGARADARELVVGAHYDSAPGTPGADDNASAVAILLEMARALSRSKPKRNLRLVFFDCEEPPHFHTGEMGSMQHARRLREGGVRLLGMICLESLGYFPRQTKTDDSHSRFERWITRIIGGRSVVVVSDVASVGFGLRFVWSFLGSGWFPFLPAALPPRLVPIIELSDHRSYWDEGFPALMVTDTAFLRNPHYHQRSDRLATLDLERMSALCRVLTRCVARLAS